MIKELWREHQLAQFPQVSRGRDVAGNDLVMLDCTTAGCVQTFVDRGALDVWHLSILALCYHDLAVVIAQLEGDERAYFADLEKLAGLILECIREGSQPA